MKLLNTSLALLTTVALVSCVSNSSDDGTDTTDPGGGTGPLRGCEALNTLDLGTNASNIVDLDAANLSPIVTDVFDRYAAIIRPTGERIHFLAQAGVDDARIRRTREILRMHLTDVPGSLAGASKGDVADAIASNCGTIAIFADAGSYDLSNAAVAAFDEDFGGAYVPLFREQIVVEGAPDYLQASPAYDRTLGACGVLTHRLGLTDVRPDWVSQLHLARINATADGTFTPAGEAPYRSLDEVYLGVLLESYYGVWGHDPSGDGSAQEGVYDFGSRAAMAAGDASTLELIERFFTPIQTFDAEIVPGFSGTFDMLLNPNRAYSNRAQYLGNVRLTGASFAELFGNMAANTLLGNQANNNIKGRDLDDVIDGGDGIDTAVYSSPSTQFTITNNGDGTLTVIHNVTPGSGTDTLRNIEVLSFTDVTINL